ncbi:MAG: hypothetical protein COS99_07865 [Candidatus Omnitrophica bacterium CG07_land_8_20_14_0_80_42_15]|uniref:ACT domain-containing protein n=1 Tax=Candidatus Aquitaenariimonas noxiae TaxID=1974741 RepID=A0A2J0KQT0_9BACT|nr:MAG: hypothetical protein COS99_07865 [Candidatus Omnitrophica bacterium CG07_land_8_20_14_0_80_42_15]
MITRIGRGKEISVGVINEVGALAKITSFLVNHSINIEAILGYATEEGQQAGLLFITDDNFSAIEALTEGGYHEVRENDVLIVEVENKPGSLKNISECLAGNSININYLYCTTCSEGCPAKVVLSTSNNNIAAKLLAEA